jgi:cholesterol oxidase
MTPTTFSPLASPMEKLELRYDVVVVGSGYGGGVAAARLARAGKRVCVLERGREVPTGGFPTRFPEMRREIRVTGGIVDTGPETALFDVRLGRDMHVVVGRGLGGGSLVNGGFALRPDPRVLADPIWPGQIRQDGLLEEGWRRAERWLRPASDPRAAETKKMHALAKGASALGVEASLARVAVSFEDTVNPAGVAQPACTRCGDCCAGCNVGAKNTVALTYLPHARRHGAQFFTHARVEHVEKLRSGGWRVHLTRLDAPRGTAPALSVEAEMVVLAAGTLGSTEILLRSRERGLALSDRLGDRFSANGDIIAFGYGLTDRVDAIGVGHPPKTAISPIGAAVSGHLEIRADELDHGIIIEEGVLPSALAPALPVMFVPNGRLLGALQSLVAGVYEGPFAHLQTYFAVSHDSAAGRLVLQDGRLRLDWPGAKDEPVLARLDEALGRLVGALGGSYVKNPLASVVGHQPATAHPLGGAIMGADRQCGVVDHGSRVFYPSHGGGATDVHQGLYVIDGAIVPRSLGVNPLLSITALAERALLHIGAEHGLTMTDG